MELNEFAASIFDLFTNLYKVHLRIRGEGFDTIHEWTDKRKDEMLDDFDRALEMADQFNLITEFLSQSNFPIEEVIDRDQAVIIIDDIIEEVVFNAESVNPQTKGVDNFIGDFIERWTHHKDFWNKHRLDNRMPLELKGLMIEEQPEQLIEDANFNIQSGGTGMPVEQSLTSEPEDDGIPEELRAYMIDNVPENQPDEQPSTMPRDFGDLMRGNADEPIT